MHWVVRWTDAETDRDMAAVLEAATRAEAEAAARDRGIPFIFVARATQSDVADARRGRAARDPGRSAPQKAAFSAAGAARAYTCLGRPLGRAQLASLMLCGVATAVLHLRPLLPAVVS